MKCDVCLTNIPLGDNRCPNCGFLMRTDHITTFDVSDDDHAHIEVTTKSKLRQDLLKKKPTFTELKKYQKRMPDRKTGNMSIKIFLIIMVIIITMVVSIVGAIISELDYDYTFNNLTFSEVIEQDYDDGTVLQAIEYKQSFITYLEDNAYQDISVVEYCNQYEDEPIQAYMNIETTKDNIQYIIDLSFSSNALQSYTLTLTGKNNIKHDRTNFPFEPNQIEVISNYLGIDNCYNVLKASYGLMKIDGDEYKYTSNNHRNVYMVEELQKDKESYSFYYSISN